MIKYALHCEKAHAFESWFPSSDSYEAQRKGGCVACPVWGSTRVEPPGWAWGQTPRS